MFKRKTTGTDKVTKKPLAQQSDGKKKRSKKKIVIPLILIAAAGCGGTFAVFGQGTDSAEIVYTEANVTRQDITSSYSFDGTISSAETQTVYATGPMTVQSLAVAVGDVVSEGDLLVTYEQDDTTALSQANTQLSSAQLQLNTAKNNLDRMTVLYEKGGISAEEYESAQNNYTNAQLNLSQAQNNYSATAEKLEDYNVYAKISGMIVSVSVSEGEDLTSGSEVMEIISYDNLEIEIVIDEYDMNNLEVGQEAIVTINSTGQTVEGYISELSRKATVTNGVSYFSGTIKLREADDSISVGTSAEVQILTSEVKNVLTVPVATVQFDTEKGQYVLIKDGNETKETAVEIGANNGQVVEITSGLTEDDIVMVPSYQNSSNRGEENEGAAMPGIAGDMPDGGMPSGGPGGNNGRGMPSGGSNGSPGMPGGF